MIYATVLPFLQIFFIATVLSCTTTVCVDQFCHILICKISAHWEEKHKKGGINLNWFEMCRSQVCKIQLWEWVFNIPGRLFGPGRLFIIFVEIVFTFRKAIKCSEIKRKIMCCFDHHKTIIKPNYELTETEENDWLYSSSNRNT